MDRCIPLTDELFLQHLFNKEAAHFPIRSLESLSTSMFWLANETEIYAGYGMYIHTAIHVDDNPNSWMNNLMQSYNI